MLLLWPFLALLLLYVTASALYSQISAVFFAENGIRSFSRLGFSLRICHFHSAAVKGLFGDFGNKTLWLMGQFFLMFYSRFFVFVK